MRKMLVALFIALGVVGFLAQPAAACGGLIAPDGDVRLARAATLVAWHNGIEHYLTSFTYEGQASNVGWIVPLPAVPTKIESGGAWTLQRLSIEAHPLPPRSIFDQGINTAASGAQVLQQVKVEALNITVVKGSGEEIVTWAYHNGFYLDDDTRAHLLAYAKASPIFMAAKYDLKAAKAKHQFQGDGVPVLITMKTPQPWIPLEVLAIDGQPVNADLYLLTDHPVNISEVNAKVGYSSVGADVPNAPGLKLAYQEAVPAQLYQDLSSDRNMGWVWPKSWFTYLTLDAPGSEVTYDMGVTNAGIIKVAPMGTAPLAIAAQAQKLPTWLPSLPMGTPDVVIPLLVLLVICVPGFFILRKKGVLGNNKRTAQKA